jgi:diguanylate cyclase
MRPLRTLPAVLLAALACGGLAQAMLMQAGRAFDLTAMVTTALAALCIFGAAFASLPSLREASRTGTGRARPDAAAPRDGLTGAATRADFLAAAETEFARCRRYGTGATLLLIDVDELARVNAAQGRDAGDLLLRETAHAIGATLRAPDRFGRLGGEEFAVFLPHADLLGALDVAERIREHVVQLTPAWEGAPVRGTVSIGVVALEPQHDGLAALLTDAQWALWEAKDAGRNCVRTAPARTRGSTSRSATRNA